MDALDMISNLEAFSANVIATEALQDHQYQYVQLNKEQLMEGKDSLGQDLSPTYFEDPYFKTPEQAKKYSDWKDKITPNPKRKKGVPNLFIIGTYHGSIRMEISEGEYEMVSEYQDAPSIEQKYGPDKLYGLNEEKAEVLINEGLADTFYEKAHQELGI